MRCRFCRSKTSERNFCGTDCRSAWIATVHLVGTPRAVAVATLSAGIDRAFGQLGRAAQAAAVELARLWNTRTS